MASHVFMYLISKAPLLRPQNYRESRTMSTDCFETGFAVWCSEDKETRMRTRTSRREFMRLGTLATGFAVTSRRQGGTRPPSVAPAGELRARIEVPSGPGLGVTIDPSFVSAASRLT
jgi:hypothetical protein